jgi:hypothetical protein
MSASRISTATEHREFRRFTDHREQPQAATGVIDSSLQVVLHFGPSSHSGMPLTRIGIFSLPSAHELEGAWITLLCWRLSASNIEKRVVQTASLRIDSYPKENREMAAFTGEFSLQIPSSIKETASEDGGVLLDVDRGLCFSLNSVGLKIWESLKEGCSADQIAEKLQREYSISFEQASTDVRTFLEELQSSGLLGDRTAKKTRGLFRRLWRKAS